jgi:hypothetical protein
MPEMVSPVHLVGHRGHPREEPTTLETPGVRRNTSQIRATKEYLAAFVSDVRTLSKDVLPQPAPTSATNRP